MQRRWDRNIHYHAQIERTVRCVRGSVLDVGCGAGQLAKTLATDPRRRVVGIDLHQPSIELARDRGGGVTYLVGDFLKHELNPESWDGIVSVAALHHMDFRHALFRVRALLRPGGVFAAVGLARSGPRDLPWDALGLVAGPVLRAGRTRSEHTSPLCWPPPLTYRQVRQQASDLLPGVIYSRLLLFRYSLTWRKPHRLKLD